MASITDHARSYAPAPIRILQFGQGNFLRAFADDFIDQLNEKGLFCGSVAVVKTTKGPVSEAFGAQNNRYTLCIQGMEQGRAVRRQRIIGCIDRILSCHEDPASFWALSRLSSLRFVISNTTEAGICLKEGDCFEGMPESFPAKLTKLLFYRYEHFAGDPAKGLILLPTELIENNALALKDCLITQSRRWKLSEQFIRWIEISCTFCNTLVDRIVSGSPKGESLTPYEDALADVCEPFASWVIAAPDSVKEELPLDRAEPPALFVKDVAPYRERKVRILNGAHTAIAPLGVLYSLRTVKDCMDQPLVRKYLMKLLEEEIKPRVPLPAAEVDSFAASVLERFENPFLNHALLSICLNSVSKFRARLLPTLRDHYRKNGTPPPCLVLAFAALLAFYTVTPHGEEYRGRTPDGTEYAVKDEPAVLELFSRLSQAEAEEYARSVARDTRLWGCSLCDFEGFVPLAAKLLIHLRSSPESALKEVLQ